MGEDRLHSNQKLQNVVLISDDNDIYLEAAERRSVEQNERALDVHEELSHRVGRRFYRNGHRTAF